MARWQRTPFVLSALAACAGGGSASPTTDRSTPPRASVSVSVSVTEGPAATGTTVGPADELQAGVEFYESASAEFNRIRDRAAEETLTYAEVPAFCAEFAPVAEAFHQDIVRYGWPDIASAAARRLAEDLRVIAELLEVCAGLPGEADAMVDNEAQLGFYLSRFDEADSRLRADLGVVADPADTSTYEATAAFYAEFVTSANMALSEVGARYADPAGQPWARLPGFCAEAAPLFAGFQEQLAAHEWPRELASSGADLADQATWLSVLLEDCAGELGTPEALEELDEEIGAALDELIVTSNAIRDAVGMEPVPRNTPPLAGLRRQLDDGIAPW
jgi:hypothetical protein